MPRPKIHFTKEQQKLANSVKCKKTYEKHKEKRKGERLKAQMKQRAYRGNKKMEESKKENRKKGVSEVVITTSETGVVQTSSRTIHILSKSMKTFANFMNKIRTPRLFTEDLYHTYLDSLSMGAADQLSLIQKEQHYISECVTSLQNDWDLLYQSVGACKELEDIHAMKAEVSVALSYVDELEFFAALGNDELQRAYKAKELWLQS